MKFKLDENMPADLIVLLRDHGHDVATADDEGLAGAADQSLLTVAAGEGRALLTFDLDFADFRHYPPGNHAGIVVFRLRDQRWKSLQKIVGKLLETNALQALKKGLAIVDESRVRWKRPKKKGKS